MEEHADPDPAFLVSAHGSRHPCTPENLGPQNPRLTADGAGRAMYASQEHAGRNVDRVLTFG